MKIFAERLHDLRIEAGLSLRDLANKTGLSFSGIRQWEKAERVPNGEAIVILAKFFSVSADYLLGLTD